MNNRKILIYVCALILFGAAVKYRQNKVIEARESSPPTFYQEWERDGKPVSAGRVFRKNLPIYEKITLQRQKGNGFYGFIPGDIRQKLMTGQKFYSETERGRRFGEITYLSDSISMDAGMYRIKAEFSCGYKCDKWLMAYVEAGRIKNALFVPRTSLVWEDDGYFLWTISKGKARKKRVSARLIDNGAVVTKGIRNGETVIHEGFATLYEGDKVQVIPGGDSK